MLPCKQNGRSQVLKTWEALLPLGVFEPSYQAVKNQPIAARNASKQTQVTHVNQRSAQVTC